MFTRTLAQKLAVLAKKFPVVSVTGPRQSGKTTLTKMVFKKYEYVSLEEPNEREFALEDPKGFLKRFTNGVILDEIQRAPSLLSYLQGIVDADDSPGRFILTGSQQFTLMEKVSQTLAGRTAIVNLLPLSLDELLGESSSDPWKIDTLPNKRRKPSFSLEKILYQGLYPRIHDQDLEAQDWLSAYYRTYVERDVRDVTNIGNLETFQRFVRLCAGRSGQLLTSRPWRPIAVSRIPRQGTGSPSCKRVLSSIYSLPTTPTSPKGSSRARSSISWILAFCVILSEFESRTISPPTP